MSQHSHNKPFYRKPLFIIVLFLVLGGILFAVFTNGKSRTSQSNLTPYTVTKENLTKTISGSGKLEAIDQRKVSAQTGSYIKEIQTEVGSVVTAGQLLARTTQQEITTDIISPIDGTIVSSNYKPGEIVGQDELFVVANISNFKTTISVSEFDVNSLTKDQKVKLKIKSISSDKEYDGLVKSIGISSENSNYSVQISLIEKPQNTRIGLVVNSIITAEKKENVITVPSDRVFKQGDSYYVRELDWINQDQNLYSLKNIKITKGLETDDKIEVLTGLNEGDTIVLETDKPAIL
jgi:HlyD family secretion protein